MNQWMSGRFGLEHQIVFTSEFLEQELFGLSDFSFVFLESALDISDAVDPEAPEQFGQLASQGQIGHQSSAAAIEPAAESSRANRLDLVELRRAAANRGGKEKQ
jgi:hypothetical protein